MTQEIPFFPKFRKLKIKDRSLFLKFNNKQIIYSDYNFISLWSYNIEEDLAISSLNGNLVVKLRDYITNQPVLSYYGNLEPRETIKALLEYSGTNGSQLKLKLVPRFNLLNNFKELEEKFLIEQDRDNFDYILSIEKMAGLLGSDFNKKRNKVSRFVKDHPEVVVKLVDLSDKENDQYLLYVLYKWSVTKETADTAHEYKAIKKLLRSAEQFNLLCIGIYLKEELVAFTIVEILPKKYALAHFTKADSSIIGIFEFLYKSTAEILRKKGCLYLNREQDLGFPGLRSAKLSWKPIKFLKKYTIKYKSAAN